MTTKEPELRGPEAARDERGRIKKGHTINPGGVSKKKRAFLDRLKDEDADTVYEAGMALIREGNAPMIIRAWEYLFGKPKETVDANVELKGLDAEKRIAIDVPDPNLVLGVLLRAGAIAPPAPDGTGDASPEGQPKTD